VRSRARLEQGPLVRCERRSAERCLALLTRALLNHVPAVAHQPRAR
jgi:hypothetical protein